MGPLYSLFGWDSLAGLGLRQASRQPANQPSGDLREERHTEITEITVRGVTAERLDGWLGLSPARITHPNRAHCIGVVSV